MKRTILYAIAIAAASFAVTSCRFIKVNQEAIQRALDEQGATNGAVTVHSSSAVEIGKGHSFTFNCEDFDSVIFDGAFDVDYTPGAPALFVESESNRLTDLSVKQEGRTIRISLPGRRNASADIRLSCPTLNSVTFNGAVEFDGKNITAEDFSCVINGAGEVDIEGLTAKNAAFMVNGAGELDIEGIMCSGTTVVEVNGAGEAILTGASSEADIKVFGAGSVDVRKFACLNLRTQKGGFGTIRK